jgi:hypothetical protein
MKVKMMYYFYVAIFLISLVLIYFAYKNYQNTEYLINTGIKAEATVVELLKTPNSNNDSSGPDYHYTPVFEYYNQSNRKISFESSISSYPAEYDIGDKVTIIHSENDEEQKIVSFWGLYVWAIVLLAVASPLFIIGGAYLLYSRG